MWQSNPLYSTGPTLPSPWAAEEKGRRAEYGFDDRDHVFNHDPLDFESTEGPFGGVLEWDVMAFEMDKRRRPRRPTTSSDYIQIGAPGPQPSQVRIPLESITQKKFIAE